MRERFLYPILLLFLAEITHGQVESNIVFYDSYKNLVYVKDQEGNRIPDFSYAGYKNSNVALPDVPVVKIISAVSGDNTSNIQTAINEIGALPFNSEGFRGAVLLTAGTYEVNGTIRLNISGVVLRGSGDGENPDSNTIIYGRGNTPSQRTILIAGGGTSTKWSQQVSGTKTNILSDTVLVGEREFEVADASSLKVGDNIIIFHPSTDLWLQSINYGGTHSGESGATIEDIPWQPGQENIVFNRYITSIADNKITVDAPVFNHLIRNRSQSYIYKYNRTGLQNNIGIENLRIDIETAGGTDGNHAWQAVDMYQIEDAWIRNCTMLHFGQSAIRTNTASRITVENCRALDPISPVEGEMRYNFNIYTGSQLILFRNCIATNARHAYVSNGYSYTSGCVFLDCTSSGAYTSSEGHRRWSTGLLYDNHKELDGPRAGLNPRLLGLYNRGHYGTSHGWALAHSVAWNCDVAMGDLIVQKPPTAQNYAIGCKGKNIIGNKPPASFNEPEGYIEATGQDMNPRSLFLAQLEERTKLSTAERPENGNNMLTSFFVYPNFPNPFNPSTSIRYYIPANSIVRIQIIDITGSVVNDLFNDIQNKGEHSLVWNIEETVSSGIYFCKVETDFGFQITKMVLAK